MSAAYSSNSNLISHLSPCKYTVQSVSDIQRLFLKRAHPTSVEFLLQDNGSKTNPILAKKLMTLFSKKTLSLKNPPLKEVLTQAGLTRQLRGLQVRPRDAARHITQITRKASKVKHFAILEENDAFVPMRIKKKVYPMRELKSFIYNHEFCKDFLKCAWYANDLKIRKTSLDLKQLRRLQRLEKIYLILKTKYLSLPEEDTKLVGELGRVLLRLPAVKHVILDQEVDPEIHPYTFFEIQRSLEGKAKVHLIADFVDVASQRNKNFSVEKIFHTIKNSGIDDVRVKYVGVAQAINRLGRSYYAPLHIKSDLYVRFIQTILTVPFNNVRLIPIVHSAYIDPELKENLVDLLRPNIRRDIPKLNLIYKLDMIEFNTTDLMLDLYNQEISSYDITIISMGNVRRGLGEKLEEHYTRALNRIQESKAELSLQVVTKDIATLRMILDIIAPKIVKIAVKSIIIQIKDAVSKDILQEIAELIKSRKLCCISEEFEIDFVQKESPKSEDLYEFLSGIIQNSSPRLKKLGCSYHNNRDCDEIIKNTFENLRSRYRRMELVYEINNEKRNYE